ncbi:hypothetical protein FJZ31_32315 [Candidatus Poribacteria bacterium]|nr:hypothetical protein [Candidatus Poribacteria bacterium]
MLIFPYERGETPPAPYIDLQIYPRGKKLLLLPKRAKIDSGASVTVIPVSLAEEWKLQFAGSIKVRGYDGQQSIRPAYWVDIIIGSRLFERVKVTVSERINILLGRDVLNQLDIRLNGPSLQVEVEAD